MQYRLEGNIFRAKQLYSLGFHLLCRCHLLALAGGYSRAVLGFEGFSGMFLHDSVCTRTLIDF